MKINRLVYWAPRIVSILFILFLALFSLDVFDMEAGFWEKAAGFFIHNIPSLVLTAILVISWKYEIVGGIAYTAAGLAYIVLSLLNPGDPWYMALARSAVISVPALLVGILFIIGWLMKRKYK